MWYHEPTFPDRYELGRWLGPAYNCGQGFASYVLSNTGKVKTRSTVSPIEPDIIHTEHFKRQQLDFTKSMESHIRNYAKATMNLTQGYADDDPYSNLVDDDALNDEEVDPQEFYDDGNPVHVPNAEAYHQQDPPFVESEDPHIGLHVTLPHAGEMKEGVVCERLKSQDGKLIRSSNPNLVLDSRQYSVEFHDGSYADYATNVLIENLYSQVDADGNTSTFLKAIIDHCKLDDAVPMSNGFIQLQTGARRHVITTRGWDSQVQWIDGSTSWIALPDLKEANPIEVAEYATAAGISGEPAFAWWTPTVLKKHERIIKLVTHRVPKKNIKFGVEVPSTVQEAFALDRKNDDSSVWTGHLIREHLFVFNQL